MLRGRLSSVILAATLGLISGGCGLSHYQQQMAEEQDRLRRIDEENEKLGDPVQLPEKKNRPAYFFRPPLGIASIGTQHESSVVQRFGLRGSGRSYFHDVSFGVERMKEEDFWGSLMRSFPGKETKDAQNVMKDTPGRGKVAFKELKSDGGETIAYVWSENTNAEIKTHAAVIFRLTRANDENARKLMDISLGTLMVGPEAARLQRAYKNQKDHEAKAAAKRREAAEAGQ
jgi:hypothetical protein